MKGVFLAKQRLGFDFIKMKHLSLLFWKDALFQDKTQFDEQKKMKRGGKEKQCSDLAEQVNTWSGRLDRDWCRGLETL